MTVTDHMVTDALRFMGIPAAQQDDQWRNVARQTFAKLEGCASPRWIWRRFSLVVEQKSVTVASSLTIESTDLVALFAHCSECYVLAATLGAALDRHIAAAQKIDMLDGLALDACASVWADAQCDLAEGEIMDDLKDGEHLTMRFSPGYGDVPLSDSRRLLELLDASRRLGVTVTARGMMLPVKSVNAIIGVSTQPENRKRSCTQCGLVLTCPYLKRGERCAT